MMNPRFDVIVIGLGAMGSAACYHLASRGARVLGLERFDIPHAQGSSHGFSRMIRLAYHEHPDYVPLLRTAYNLWHRLEAQSGRKLLHVTGGLYLGPPGSAMVRDALRAADQHAIAYERLDGAQLARRYPQFRLPADYEAMFEHHAGFLLPEQAICAHVELALRHGAELHGREEFIGWKGERRGVSVTTERAGRMETYQADKIVFCGGPWTKQLLKALGVSLTVTRQVLGWVWPRDPSLFTIDRFPVWAMDDGASGLYYGFPLAGPGVGDAPGLKLARHRPGTPTDPDRVSRELLPGDEEEFRPMLRDHLPAGDGPLLSLRVCLYTNSPDGHFIIDAHPGTDRALVACGFSGHGFKFAPVIGQVLADLATAGRTELPIDFLRLGRFAGKSDNGS